MFRLIFKNLWARRRRNGWLLAELVAVTVISWAVLDPVAVLTYDRQLPDGYDVDRLCMVNVGALVPIAPGYDPAANDSARLMDDYLSLVDLAAGYEGVECAAPVLDFCYPNSFGSSLRMLNAEGDSIGDGVMQYTFLPHTRYFETFGFGAVEGELTPAQLSDYDYTPGSVVLTADAARQMFGDKPLRRRVQYAETDSTWTYAPVVGTVQPFKPYNDGRYIPIVFTPMLEVEVRRIQWGSAYILLRLKPGVSPARFLHDFRPWMMSQMRRGNLFGLKAQSYADIIGERNRVYSDSIYHRNLMLAAFFLINLCLGAIGTFWLQTRTRREEVGVMRSFGATRRRVWGMLLGEGAVLTLVAVVVGCLLYLPYALTEGLVINSTGNSLPRVITCWVESFPLHYLLVSAGIFVLLLAVVLAGISIPAWHASRVPPVDALRDE